MPGPMLHAVDVNADPAVVYRAITTQVGLASFWTPACDVSGAVGSVATFGFEGAPVDLRMRIDELTEGSVVRWTCLGDFPYWADTAVRWDVEPAASGAGSTVRFRQSGWPEAYPELDYARVNYTWGRIVGALKGYVESGAAQPFLR